MTVRWGIAATGGIAHTTVGDLQATPNSEVVAVASRSQERAEAFAAKYAIGRAYASYDAMLSDDEIDIVYVCTPHAQHADVVQSALLAGKHVLCEKSLTTTAAEAREIAALAAEQGLLLVEAMWTRFNPAICRLLDELEAGLIGDVRTVQAQFGFDFPRGPTSRLWRADLGGGALLDLCVYPLSLIHMVLGVPDTLRAIGDIQPDGVDVTESVLLQYDDGRFGHALSSISSMLGSQAIIGGTRGMVILEPSFHALETYRVILPMSREERRVTIRQEGAGYRPMFRAVTEAVEQGLTEHPLRPLRDTIAVLDIMDEIRRQLVAACPPSAQ